MAGMPSQTQETDVTDYIKKSIDKGQQSESRAEVALHPGAHQKGVELKHGEWIKQADASLEPNDKDYVFIHFILHNLPKGLIGLLLAVILSAAMSSTASELNALGTISALDLYKRNKKGTFTDKHYVQASKIFTLIWGIVAISIACIANLFDNLIQLVNIIGSVFYGNVLGIFLLAFFFKYVKGNAVFFAAILTQLLVFFTYYNLIHIYPSGEEKLGYLWLNFIGSVLVIVLAFAFEGFDRLLKNPPIKHNI